MAQVRCASSQMPYMTVSRDDDASIGDGGLSYWTIGIGRKLCWGLLGLAKGDSIINETL